MTAFSAGRLSLLAQGAVEALLSVVLGVLLGYWIAHLGAGAPYPIAPPAQADAAGGNADPMAGVMTTAVLFGSRRPGGAAANMQVLGLIADAAGQGGAIVAIEGQPPRVVRVGERLEGRLVTAIDAHGVTLEGGPRDTVPLLARPAGLTLGTRLDANLAAPVANVPSAAPPAVVIPALQTPADAQAMSATTQPR